MEGILEAMALPYLTIAEAVEKTGKSPSTVRRIIRSITDRKSHPDRGGIDPAPGAVEQFRKKGENFTWKICEDVLLKNLRRVQNEEKNLSSSSVKTSDGGILDILQKELEIKNRQIEKQGEIIQSLNERLREGNILMATLQKQLALPSPSGEHSISELVTVKASTEGSMEASRRPPKKNTGGQSKKSSSIRAPKRGLFSWFRRS